jgi:hypothetical protein
MLVDSIAGGGELVDSAAAGSSEVSSSPSEGRGTLVNSSAEGGGTLVNSSAEGGVAVSSADEGKSGGLLRIAGAFSSSFRGFPQC